MITTRKLGLHTLIAGLQGAKREAWGSRGKGEKPFQMGVESATLPRLRHLPPGPWQESSPLSAACNTSAWSVPSSSPKHVDRIAVTRREALTSGRLVVAAFNHGVQQRPHLLWVPQGLSKHLLNVSHDGYFLMSFERIFDSLRGGSPLIPEVHSDGNSPI